MQLEKGHIYHIYNQGNNHRKLFFDKENYLFFLKKIKAYISPYTDIIAWCLMPNHFHLMVLVREVELPVRSKSNVDSQGFTQSEALTDTSKTRTFNESIGIMLRTYTRAINKQENSSGSLFRKDTKAECINCHKGMTPSFLTKNGVAKINYQHPEKQYPQVCFNYIHQNPVKAKLVKNTTDWEFSSAIDYADLRKGKLINKEVASNYIDF